MSDPRVARYCRLLWRLLMLDRDGLASTTDEGRTIQYALDRMGGRFTTRQQSLLKWHTERLALAAINSRGGYHAHDGTEDAL